jgi:hypothetical protein
MPEIIDNSDFGEMVCGREKFGSVSDLAPQTPLSWLTCSKMF